MCKLFLPLRPWKVCSLSGVPSCHLLPAPSSWYGSRSRWQERPSSRVNDSLRCCCLGKGSAACSWELEPCKPAGSEAGGTALSGTPRGVGICLSSGPCSCICTGPGWPQAGCLWWGATAWIWTQDAPSTPLLCGREGGSRPSCKWLGSPGRPSCFQILALPGLQERKRRKSTQSIVGGRVGGRRRGLVEGSHLLYASAFKTRSACCYLPGLVRQFTICHWLTAGVSELQQLRKTVLQPKTKGKARQGEDLLPQPKGGKKFPVTKNKKDFPPETLNTEDQEALSNYSAFLRRSRHQGHYVSVVLCQNSGNGLYTCLLLKLICSGII